MSDKMRLRLETIGYNLIPHMEVEAIKLFWRWKHQSRAVQTAVKKSYLFCVGLEFTADKNQTSYHNKQHDEFPRGLDEVQRSFPV